MWDEISKIQGTRAELRRFSWILGIAGILFSLYFLWKKIEFAQYALGFSIAFSLIGTAFPNLYRPLHKFWIGLSIVLGHIMTRVILTLTFFLLIFPIGFMAKIVGKKFLTLNWEKEKNSYWIPKGDGAPRYDKQY